MKLGLVNREYVSQDEYLGMTGKGDLPDQSQITVLTAPISNLIFYRDSKSGLLLPIVNEGIVSYSGDVRTLRNLVRGAIKLDGGTEGQLEDVLTGLSNGGGDIPWNNKNVIFRINEIYQSRTWTKEKPTELSYVPYKLFDNLEFRTEMEAAYCRLSCDPSFNRPFTSFPDLPDEVISPRGGRKALKKEKEKELFLMYNYFKYRLSGTLENIQPGRYSKKNFEANKFYNKVQRVWAWIADYNMALVLTMARRTKIPGVDFSELVSEGNMALLRAIDKFDVSRGFKFSTYACRAILKGFNRMASKEGRYAQRFPTGIDPEMERSDYDVLKHQMQQDSALDDLREVMSTNYADLTDVERTVITQRFALDFVDGKKKTLSEVELEFGLITERVRQIQKKALGKLKIDMGRLCSREGMPSMISSDNPLKLYNDYLTSWEFNQNL